jgi:hypothetical protein
MSTGFRLSWNPFNPSPMADRNGIPNRSGNRLPNGMANQEQEKEQEQEQEQEQEGSGEPFPPAPFSGGNH